MGAKSNAIARQEYSTNISEEYEYSHEKAERVSLPHKPFITANKRKEKTTDAPRKTHSI
jgi:hypothetical protein